MRNTEQINVAGVKVGDWLRMKPATQWSGKGHEQVPAPGKVESANPTHDKGVPLRVSEIHKVPGEGTKWFSFEDTGDTSVARAGTAFQYRYLLSSAGEPIPDKVLTTCPRCKSDGPSCQGPSGPVKWHAARVKLADQEAKSPQRRVLAYPDGQDTPVELVLAVDLKPKDEVYGVLTRDGAGQMAVLPHTGAKWEKGVLLYRVKAVKPSGPAAFLLEFDGDAIGVGVRDTRWLRRVGKGRLPEPRADLIQVAKDAGKLEVIPVKAPLRDADTIDASYAATQAGSEGKTVQRKADGTVVIHGWDKGDGEYVTPEGWKVHVTADGIVTVVGTTEQKAAKLGRGTLGDTSRRALDTARADDESVEYDESDPLASGEKCYPCKGYGLVRGKGKNAGQHYRTFDGAQLAQANGNAVDCPACEGAGLVAA